ncbi:hypothetical protein LTR65_001286 [Meristemomyces frigidus]
MTPRSLLLALLSGPLLVLAQNANPFKIPTSGLSATAGQAVDLEWNPTTQGSITLILRSGASNDLVAGTVIAQSIANNGSYSWTPSESITRGWNYTVEIVDDTDASNTNYTPYFYLDSHSGRSFYDNRRLDGQPNRRCGECLQRGSQQQCCRLQCRAIELCDWKLIGLVNKRYILWVKRSRSIDFYSLIRFELSHRKHDWIFVRFEFGHVSQL